MSFPISDVLRRVVYSGSAGVGPYSFSFEILTSTDINVYKNSTLLTLTTDYSVSISEDGTGSVTLVSAATSSDNITLVGARSIERSTDFVTGGDLFANTLNQELDSVVIFAQQVDEKADRGLKAPITDPTDINMELPVKASRRGKVLAFDETSGDPVAGPDLSAMTTVIAQSANINTVAASIDSVNTVAGNTSNINTVAGISGNVTTVAGISSNVTTVAGISSNVTSVAGNATNINAVAANATNINAVASNETNIDTVAAELTDIGTVAGLSTEIAALGPIASDITTVAGIESDVTAVADDATDIGTVAGSIASVNTVADVSSNVTTVAGIAANVTTVAGISADVTTVATNNANVTTVATNIAAINTVSGDIAAIITTANDLNEAVSEIEVVANNIASVDTVGDNIASVNAVAAIDDDVSIAAANVADITNFADVYQGASSTAPTTRNDTSALQVGDLYFNTTDDQMKVYGGSGWQSVGSTVNGTSQRYRYIATASQTTFTGSDTNTNTLAYDVGFIDVYLNGVRLDQTDYTATSGDSVVLASGAAADDEVNIVTYGNFELADHYNKTDSDSRYVNVAGDTMTGSLGIGGNVTGVIAGVSVDSKFCVKQEGTDPVAGFVKAENTTAGSGSATFACRSRGTLASPTVVQSGDALWNMYVAGHDGTDLALAAEIAVEVDGTPGSNDMPGRIVFKTTPDGQQAPVESMRIDSAGNVGIGTSSPSQKLDVNGTVNATNLTRGGSQVYSRNNILGTVSESGGVPTGAIIERGSNANGEYVKYADGTMICTFRSRFLGVSFLISAGDTLSWTFPSAFSEIDHLTVNLTNDTSTFNGLAYSSNTDLSTTSVLIRNHGSNATYFVAQAIGRWF
jgi:hypothetical protein